MTRFRFVLVALYAADVALLGWLVPHRPAYAIDPGHRVNVTATGLPPLLAGDLYLFGFSPDGRLIATASGDPLDASEDRTITVSLWDVTGPPRWVADRPLGALAYLGWNWPNDPGRRWLFWQCYTADDPEAKLAQLYPGVTLDPERLDPTERPPRFRASPDGRYYLLRVPPERFEVTERAGGRVLWKTPSVETTPVFGPGPDDLTVLEPTGDDGRTRVTRFVLPSGHETFRTAVELPMAHYTRLTPDGRTTVSRPTSQYSLTDLALNKPLVTVTDDNYVRWVDPPGRLIAVEGEHQAKNCFARFWRAGSDAPIAVVPSPTGHFSVTPVAAVAADGSAVALLSDRLQGLAGPLRLVGPRWLQRCITDVNRRLVGPSDALTLCDVAEGRVLATLSLDYGNPNRVTGEGLAAFSPDGRRLATRHADGIRIWDLPLARPWLWILALAAAPPASLALTAAGVRRLRRGRR